MGTGYRGRRRTGCLTCRAAKVRCDEQQPVCRRCVRLERSCVYKYRSNRPSDTQSPQHVYLQTIGVLPPPAIATHRGQVVQPPHTPSNVQESPQQVHLQATGVLPSPETTAHHGKVVQSPHTPSSAVSPETTTTSQPRTPSLQAMMVSQDIYLCTTIDLMAVNSTISAQPPFDYFARTVSCPFITPYDPVNWHLFKHHCVRLAVESSVLAPAVRALQLVHRAQMSGLSISRALPAFSEASQALESAIRDRMDFNVVLTATLLLCLCQAQVPEEIETFQLAAHEDAYLHELDKCAEPDPMTRRICAWSLLLHAAARRGGNPGLLSPALQTSIRRGCGEPTSLPLLTTALELPTLILAQLGAPLFAHHLQMQLLSAQIANLSHYHRSRITSDDQEEVAVLMAGIEDEMKDLWHSRPALLRSAPAEVRRQLSATIADPLLQQVAIAKAVYNTELVENGRTLSDPPLASDSARLQLSYIRQIVELGEYSLADSGTLHPALLRPLFLYAIESIKQADSLWAVNQIRKIRSAGCRSDFFATFAEGLSQAQREKGRRVTTKWYCLQVFDVSPPWL